LASARIIGQIMELEKNPIARRFLKRLWELADKLFGKPFPEMRRVKQVSIYACGPAVEEMLFSFFGVKVSQKSMIKSLRAQTKVREYGLNVKDLTRATSFLGKKEYYFWEKRDATIHDLWRAVHTFKSPVGVEWQGVFYENEDGDSGHYGVVTGVDKKTGYVRIADPYFNGIFRYNGVDRRFPIRLFEKRWWDENIIGGRSLIDNRVMFVITPKSETWPKKLGMIRK